MKPAGVFSLLATIAMVLPSCRLLESDSQSVIDTPDDADSRTEIVMVDGFAAGDGVFELGEPTLVGKDEPVWANRYQDGDDGSATGFWNVSGMPVLFSGKADRFSLYYSRSDSRERDVWFMNMVTGQWDLLLPGSTDTAIYEGYHSGWYPIAGDGLKYLSSSGDMAVRVDDGIPMALYAARDNPDCKRVKPGIADADGSTSTFSGIASDGDALWLLASEGNRLLQVDSTGAVLQSIAGDFPFYGRLAYGASAIWLSSVHPSPLWPSDNVVCVRTDGTAVGAFSVQNLSGAQRGIEYAAGSLWFAVEPGPCAFLVRVDPEASIESGEAVVLAEYPLVGTSWINGLAWDGNHFITVGHDGNGAEYTLRVDTDGSIIERIEAVPTSYNDLTSFDGKLWSLFHHDFIGCTLPPVNEVTE